MQGRAAALVIGAMVAAAVVSAGPADALSEALARKCLALTMQEYPRPKGWVAYKPGNAGTARLREAYYRDCLAKQGNIAVAVPNNTGEPKPAEPR